MATLKQTAMLPAKQFKATWMPVAMFVVERR
jgi:hypothetical protein